MLGVKSELSIDSLFHIIGDSIILLSGDLTEKINPKIKNIVTKIMKITFLSGILFIDVN